MMIQEHTIIDYDLEKLKHTVKEWIEKNNVKAISQVITIHKYSDKTQYMATIQY